MITEIGARDFGDPGRYNLLEVSCHRQVTSLAKRMIHVVFIECEKAKPF